MSQTMREALALAKEAIDAVEDWSGYAGDYFKEKHKLAEELAEYRARLAALSAPSSEQEAAIDRDEQTTQWVADGGFFHRFGGEDHACMPLSAWRASRPAAAAPTAEQILALERRSPMSDDEALRFGRAVLLLAERAAAAAPAGGVTALATLTQVQRDLLRNLGSLMAHERSREPGDAWDQLSKLMLALAATAPAGGVTPGAYLRKKAEDYAMEYGSDDMGGLSFGSGAHAEVKMDHYNNLLELAEELDALTPAARAVEPEAPLWAAGLVSESMVTAYLEANDQYWRETDALPQRNPSKWRNGTAREATRVSLIAALVASTTPTPPTGTSKEGGEHGA